jgi:tripartite-type tricarboxylate transporter receptor subunit TctC
VRPPRDGGTPAVRDAAAGEAGAAVRETGGAEAGASTGSAAEEARNAARQAILSGDYAACIVALTRAPQTCSNIELLVTCYKSENRMSDAHDVMANYVRRCEGQRKYEEYVQILQGAGRGP